MAPRFQGNPASGACERVVCSPSMPVLSSSLRPFRPNEDQLRLGLLRARHGPVQLGFLSGFVFAELALGTFRAVDGDLELVLNATGEHRPPALLGTGGLAAALDAHQALSLDRLVAASSTSP